MSAKQCERQCGCAVLPRKFINLKTWANIICRTVNGVSLLSFYRVHVHIVRHYGSCVHFTSNYYRLLCLLFSHVHPAAYSAAGHMDQHIHLFSKVRIAFFWRTETIRCEMVVGRWSSVVISLVA